MYSLPEVPVPCIEEDFIGRIDFTDFSSDVREEVSQGTIDMGDHVRISQKFHEEINDFFFIISVPTHEIFESITHEFIPCRYGHATIFF